MGGYLNAYTLREQTTYYVRVMDKDVPRALDILANILQNSKFDDNRINHEHNVILREIEEVILLGIPSCFLSFIKMSMLIIKT